MLSALPSVTWEKKKDFLSVDLSSILVWLFVKRSSALLFYETVDFCILLCSFDV